MRSDSDHLIIMRAYDRAWADAEWLARDTTEGWYLFNACPDCNDTVFQQPNGYCHCLNCKWQTQEYMESPHG